ncbi:MAG TPA: hypothetical protein VFA06_01790 [Actinocrinis sp.]|uniref:hypothetical protein n=1 Tax=Actinocrinis sp. TaxID=1920516 RepID=UPI002D6E0535|nr:hypothetical protein [Actinocrinis sp.]HZU54578.1 hypothetical protein [Actinocrinis sp.]
MSETQEQDGPRELLSAAAAAARAARRTRQGAWFPLLLLGLIIVGAIPFYRLNLPTMAPGSSGVLVGRREEPIISGEITDPRADWYWLIALIAGYGAIALFYRWRARRTGVAGRIWPYTVAGLLLFALLLTTGSEVPAPVNLQRVLPGELAGRGLLPLITIGLGLFVLAWTERSLLLAALATVYLALAVVANLYDTENLFYRLGWISPWDYENAPLPNLLLPAVPLLLGGAVFALRTWRAR